MTHSASSAAGAIRRGRAAASAALVGLCLVCLVCLVCLEAAAESRSGQGYVGGQAVSSKVYQAATLVNDAVSLIRENRNQEAADKLEEAVRLAPDLAQARHNLGICYAKLGRPQEAAAELRAALDLKPDMDATWLTLGGIYQSTGHLDEAVAAYREFLSRFPGHRESAKITSLVKGLESEQQLPAAGSGPRTTGQGVHQQPDYYAEVTQGGLFRWPAARMPLKVHIRPGESVPGYRESFRELLERSFKAWAEASGGLVRVEFVSSPRRADIDCSWTADPGKLSNPAEAGEAKVVSDRLGINRGTIVLLTVPLTAELPLTDSRMETVCLHEVGHVLGMAGHTRHPQDVMFYSGSLTDARPTLSVRDVNTIRRLYAPAP